MKPIQLVTTLLALATALAPSFAAGAPPGVDNGFVIMVHGHLDVPTEPAGLVPHPRPAEAFTATLDRDAWELAIIPYATWTERPEQVWETSLVVTRADGTSFEVAPEEGFGRVSREVCEVETSIPGHEGALEACAVFRVPASEVAPGSAVTLEFRGYFMDQRVIEPYSAVAHAMLHGAIEGGHGSVQEADQRGEPTPYLLADDLL